jgi:uncharacterized protein YqjF (DUF2071 family)
MRPFLTAEWRNLFIASYPVAPSLLERRLPPGLSLDIRDGSAFVSLVAFEFLQTRLGSPLLRIPARLVSRRNFAELNLRFYVRQGEQRGVVFIREFVPQRLVAWMARLLYNQPYLAAPLWATRVDSADAITMDYRLQFGGREHRIQATGDKPAFRPGDDSVEHFFKEHHWGYGRTRSGQAIRYEVAHPVWDVYAVRSYKLDFDFAAVYGPEWDILQQAVPVSTILAVGSPIGVFPKGELVSG